jgi:TrmH family RNA methyltransferase
MAKRKEKINQYSEFEIVDSIKDPRVVEARELCSGKAAESLKKILIEGQEAIDWAIENRMKVETIFFHSGIDKAIIQKYADFGVTMIQASEGILKKISDTNYLTPLLGVGLIDWEFKDEDFTVLMDDVRDFGNIGAIIRTCRAFGIESIGAVGERFTIYNKKTIDASRGRALSTRYKRFGSPLSAVEYYKSNGYAIVTTSPYGESVQSLAELDERPIVLVVGNETNGASKELMEAADKTIRIPMNSSMESLNVGVAAGISIYELKIKQVLAMIDNKIKSTLGREVNVLAMLIRKSLDAELRKISELNSDQAVFLMVLNCDKKMNILDFQRQFGIIDSDLDGFINPLLAKGYIRILEDEIEIDDKASDWLSKIWTIIENTEKSLLADLSDDEIRVFKKAMHTIKNNCVELIEKSK